MCTRYYIDNTDPILIPIIEEAEKSPLCNRFLLEEKIDEWTRPETDPSGLVGCAVTEMVWERVI